MKPLTLLLMTPCFIIVASAGVVRAEGPDFVREVRPILSKACFHCHGPDTETREADLRLDRPEGLFDANNGRSIIHRGHSDQSELIRRIVSNDPDEVMPPASSGKSLTAQQKQVLVDWINAGAEWKEHWAFKAPVLPPVPAVAPDAKDWAQNEIDRFILERLKSSGLNPSKAANPETLVRRVFLDLIGLPPTSEEARQWTARLRTPSGDASQDADLAWKELVDHLLSRPEYGERWARHWLDLARYADTNGYEKDRPRSIWPYRDWVIQAINSDMPFDQFTIEQIAGDMLPNATASQKVATGFHRNTMLNEEGGIDPLEFRFHAMTDRVATTGTTWLGLTTGCAQCHTHKYDPLTHREYYQLMAFLNNADEPSLALPDASIEARQQANQNEAARLIEELPYHWPVPDVERLATRIVRVESTGAEQLTPAVDAIVNVSGPVSDKATYTVDVSLDPKSAVGEFPREIQFEAFSNENAPGPGRSGNGNFVLTEFQISLLVPTAAATNNPATNDAKDTASREIPLKIASVKATVQQKDYVARSTIDGDSATGWAVDTGNGVSRQPAAVFRIAPGPLREALAQLPEGSVPVFRIRLEQNHGSQHVVGKFRLSFVREVAESDLSSRRQQFVDAAFDAWLSENRRKVASWETLSPSKATSNMPYLTIESDGSVFASGDTTKQDRYEITLRPSSKPITAIRLEAIPDPRLPGNGPGTTFYEGSLGDFYLNEFSILANGQPVVIKSATDSYRRNKFGNTPVAASLTIDGDVQTGWSVNGGEGQRHCAVYVLDQPIPAGTELNVSMIFGRHFASSLGRFRLQSTDSTTAPIATSLTEEQERLLLVPDDQLADAGRAVLKHEFLLSASELSEHAEKIRALLKPVERTTTLVMSERPPENPRPTHRHHRGEYLQPKELLDSGTPEFLHGWNSEWPKNRLGFAKWLVDEKNPLTARVVVNRHWAALFGRGLVATVDDFGIQGMAPSHPELLDWLAVTWMTDDQWSLKRLHRRIVLSAAYRQDSVASDDAIRIDPSNELLSHANRVRLDAEVIRDSIVQAAGVLSKKTGGPPVRPMQPPGITEVAFGSPSWDVSDGEDRYRRSIYTLIKRTAPFAMVTTFDGPTGEACVAKRNRSNTPLQALTLLNDPMFIDLARVAGRRLAQMPDRSDEDRIRLQFEELLSRSPDESELTWLTSFLKSQRAVYSGDPSSARALMQPTHSPDDAVLVEQASWAGLARALWGLDEVVMRP